jgi:predicted transcriptional regulator of viral defense system
VQSFTNTDTEVIGRAQRKRRGVIVLREDRDWLTEFSSRPADLLLRMAARGALIKLGAGRYAISELGSSSVHRKTWQPLLHARLAPLGNYYLGFFSALEEHRLTDLSEPRITVATGINNKQLRAGRMRVAGRPIGAAYTTRPVFGEGLGIETVHPSRTERYRRSDMMRTLVDCLWHPELSGATETWVTAWGRASRLNNFDPEVALRYALPLGPSVARRVAFMLEVSGHGDAARRTLPKRLRRSDRHALLIADGPSGDGYEVDDQWRVTLNVPRDRIEGWLAYGK